MDFIRISETFHSFGSYWPCVSLSPSVTQLSIRIWALRWLVHHMMVTEAALGRPWALFPLSSCLQGCVPDPKRDSLTGWPGDVSGLWQKHCPV